MSETEEIISQIILSKPMKSEESVSKLMKPTRKLSRLPKCTQLKSSGSIRNAEQGDDAQLDFASRMKMKNKISELQQANNELKFKLTAIEAKLKSKDSEVITADSLNKQLKYLLDKHINREHELDSQILNFEKKILKLNKQVTELEEDKRVFLAEKKEIQSLMLVNEELKANLSVKDAQILDLSGQIAEVKRSLSHTSMKNQLLELQLGKVKRIQPMLDVRGKYINILEDKIRDFEKLCTDLNEENCELKLSMKSLENFRFYSLLASMNKTTNLLQI